MLESIESRGLGSILLEAQHLNCIVSLTDIPLPAVQLAIEDESQVEEEASSTPQAQEKKDASPAEREAVQTAPVLSTFKDAGGAKQGLAPRVLYNIRVVENFLLSVMT